MGDNNLICYKVGSDDPIPDTAFVGLVNGADAPLLALDLPAGLRGKARFDVALRQIQDQLGRASRGVEFVPYLVQDAKSIWSHAIVKPTLSAFESLVGNPSCEAILPDFLALPAGRDIWTIEVGKTQTKVRIGLTDGFTAEHDLAAALLTMTPNSVAPLAILRLGGKNNEIDKVLRGSSVPICKTIDEVKAQGLPAPTVFQHGELAMDLRQTASVFAETVTQGLRGIMWPALAAVLALGVWSTSMWITLERAKTQTREVRQETHEIVRSTFVPNGPILDIRSQVSQAISQVREERQESDTDAPLGILRRTGVALENLNGTIETASFSAAEGLILRLALDDFAALDRAMTALTENGLSARIGSSDTSAQNVVNATVFVGTSK